MYPFFVHLFRHLSCACVATGPPSLESLFCSSDWSALYCRLHMGRFFLLSRYQRRNVAIKHGPIYVVARASRAFDRLWAQFYFFLCNARALALSRACSFVLIRWDVWGASLSFFHGEVTRTDSYHQTGTDVRDMFSQYRPRRFSWQRASSLCRSSCEELPLLFKMESPLYVPLSYSAERYPTNRQSRVYSVVVE